MRRHFCLVAVFILAALCVPIALAAGGEPRRSAEPVCITQGAGDDGSPAIGVNPDGGVFVAWQHRDPDSGAIEIHLSQTPYWETSSIVTIPSPQPERVALSLNVGERVHLAWSEPTAFTQTVVLRSLHPALTKCQTGELPVPFPSSFVVDGEGCLHSVWAEGNVISYRNGSSDATVTTTLEAGITVGELWLALEGEALPHLAWSASELPGQTAAIYYASLTGQVRPVQVAVGGSGPRLAVGPSGRAHLCWTTQRGLHYATNQDWTVSRIAVPDLLESDAFAIAAGPGKVAHLVWAQDDALWYANSADWRHSTTRLAKLANVSQLDIAVDPRGRPHIVCAAANAEGVGDVYYIGPAHPSPQLRVPYPRGGEVLGRDILIQAESNLLTSDLLRVEFYLQIGDQLQESEDILMSLGLDRDGRDGWSVPLHIAELSSTARYRVVALGIDLLGRMTKAVGNWFTVHRQAPWVWLEPPAVDASRGKAWMAALAGSGEARLAHLDLFFTPVGCESNQGPLEDVWAMSPRPVYAGSYDLPLGQSWPGTRWRQLVYDSRTLSDGRYTALAVVTDRLGRRGHGHLTTYFTIDNTMPPNIEVTSPGKDAIIRNVLEASAIATDRDGSVQRVDFFAERSRPLSQTQYRGQEYELEVPDLLWLGSDTDGLDGWSIRVPLDETLHGDHWFVRAVAFDDQGFSTAARSPGAFAVVGRQRPHMVISTPASGSRVRGTQTVKLLVREGHQYLQHAQVYLESLDDTLTYLGPMAETDERWVYVWDTTAFADGLYDLLIVGHHIDGGKSLVRSDKLSIANASSSHQFEEPAPDQVLRGAVLLRLEDSQSNFSAETRFYYRDAAGQLRFIARGTRDDDGWCAVWDTTATLDGAYELVASVISREGHTSHVTQEVPIRNVTPSITFQPSVNTGRWQGTREIAWLAEHPSGKPVSVTVEYSPDAGARWIGLAANIPSSKTFLWDTERYPDSRSALLRLTVSDGVHSSQSTSEPFVLNNVNEAPHVALLAPRSGAVCGNQVDIAWQAWDPDNDWLVIDLDYRRRDGPWINLARSLSNGGHHTWETGQLAPARDYELRITAIDSLDAAGTDAVHSIHLASNSPPEVHLLAPKGGEHFDKETIIFWRATDEDDDELSIDLYYSDNAGQVWLPLAEGAPNTGYHVWQVSYLPMGTQYRVRVTARDGLHQASDESDNVLSVGSHRRPEVRLLSPLAGSDISGIQLVRWWASSPDGTPLRITLMVRRSGSYDWEPILENAPDDGFYLWDTQSYPEGPCELRITVTDGQSSASATLSDPVAISNRSNHPPRVVLASPKGGESWMGIREILWQAWDRDGDVITATLYLSLDGGQEWDKFASLDARAGTYLWDTSQTFPGRQALVRILVTDGIATAQDTSQGVFSLTNRHTFPPHALFTSPDGSGKLLRGNAVAWMAEDVDGDPLSISLSFTGDGGLTWHDLASGLPGTGEYVLDTRLLKAGSQNRLRLQVSDGVYRIQTLSSPLVLASPAEDKPELKIESPGGGERWSGVQRVQWRASDPMGQSLRLDIELSNDGGRSWTTLAAGLPNTGVYTWDTPRLGNGVYCLRLAADNGQVRSMETSETFVVYNLGRNAPVISVVSPRGGEIWWGTQEVKWRAVDPDGDALTVSLAYSLDVGATWHTLARSIPDVGSYVWDTTSIPNCDLVWLRATVSDGQQTSDDLSDGPFSVRNPRAPVAVLLAPAGGELWTGKQDIAWHVAHDSGRTVKVTLQVSLDMGQSWQTLATDLPWQGAYSWDTSALPENARALVRVYATDGLQSAVATAWEPVTIVGNATLASMPLYVPQ